MICSGASIFGSELQADGILAVLSWRNWAKWKTSRRSSGCLHIFFPVELQPQSEKEDMQFSGSAITWKGQTWSLSPCQSLSCTGTSVLRSLLVAPASRLMGVVQAMAFCRHVLDMPEIQSVLDSKRCAGAAKELDPKERKQASPLSVQELQKLHAVVDAGEDDWDTIFAGAALLCCYCRGRWGDLMRSETAFLDCDDQGTPTFLETRTGRHKTMAAQMHKHQFLPMVAPVRGIHGEDWVTPWIKKRSEKGLDFPPKGLIMPAPDRHGDATERPLESGECGKWLRRLLMPNTEKEAATSRRVSSHSLKCTFLSFAAKRGLPVPERFDARLPLFTDAHGHGLLKRRSSCKFDVA